MNLGKMELKPRGEGYCFAIPKWVVEQGVLKTDRIYVLEVTEVGKKMSWDDF